MEFFFEYKSSKIKIDKNLITGMIKVFENDREVERLKEKNKPFLLDNIDKLYIKSNGLDFIVPKVIINTEEILLARKLTSFEQLLCFSPSPLIIIGGAIGGGLAVTGAIINLNLIRSGNNKVSRYVKVITCSIASYILYFSIALLIKYYIKK